ncbi:MAG: Maf family protein, partial [Dysosmobacter sp.]|nr:Maf family protein [Dysosmobacter sp.]
PEIIPSQVEEVVTSSDPEQVVMELAGQKAREVADRLGDNRIVVGSDTVVAVDGAILGKPASEEEACAMIRRIAGRTHQVFTGVAIVRGQREKTFAVESRVTVYPMSEEEIRGYVAAGESMDKAGAYGVQGLGALLVERLDGDFFNVMGLPVLRLSRMLERFGVHFFC